jgi:hypothetical protein
LSQAKLKISFRAGVVLWDLFSMREKCIGSSRDRDKPFPSPNHDGIAGLVRAGHFALGAEIHET